MAVIENNFWEGKKVFVTGHTGFKGTWLCKVLLMLGAEITGYSLPPSTDPNLFQILKLHEQKKLTTIIGDIRDFRLLKQCIIACNAEIIIHLAAQPIVRASYSEPLLTYDTNVMGTVNLLEAIRACGTVKSVINITTDKVYYNEEKAEGYGEDEFLCGYDPYSNSKSCSELVTYSYKNSFFSSKLSPAISTARSGNVIGGGDFALDRIIPDCCRTILSGGRTIFLRNPSSIRPYQHVLDSLYGYILLAELQYADKERYEGCYNFGPNDKDCISTGELVTLFCDRWNVLCKKNSLNWDSRKENGPHEATFLKLNCSKAKNILGWNPVWPVTTAVEEATEWLHAYVHGIDIDKQLEKSIEQYWMQCV